MENGASEVAEKLLELSTSLNTYIREYHAKSVLLQTLLANDDEESILKIQETLNQREALIKNYDNTSLEFKREQNLIDNNSMFTEELTEKLSSLKQERQSIFETIRDLENRNLTRISELYTDNRGHIKQIEEGKRLINAYQGNQLIEDGLYFDRRK